ncbi:hypothetical protein CFN78_18010 [Amycolatopsis antarctica]|uniref:Uncharacterized protein n=1 Tax=Amycolatopsis antarctica TaxID=1854586 RepID=A0A263D0S6_9PSEU|nr:hypothetical protein CFN78_18010 [Amycolatopsis antarctica]
MLADHPKTMNLREDVVLPKVRRWIGGLFHRDNIDRTVGTLAGSQGDAGSDRHESAKRVW